MRVVWMAALVACGATSAPAHRTDRTDRTERPRDVEPVEPVDPGPTLYALEDALGDALSGTWTYVGTGPWFGIQRIQACVYRNQRVIVVNVYCTVKEQPAFRLDVFSPTRGRASIYAEAPVPISTVTRADYFTFKGEVQPAPVALPLALSMSHAQLRAYDERRYYGRVPACYGGVEIKVAQGGCTGELKARASEFAIRNRAFLREPPRDWYRLVKDMRDRARVDGRNIERAGG